MFVKVYWLNKMISLKEVKTRIQSVSSTRQITAAMKMVSSAKLHKAQKTIGDFYLYQTKLNQILKNFLEYELKEEGNHSFIPFSDERELKKVTIVAVSSNNSLCGGFNSHVIKSLETTIDEYAYLGEENIRVIPIGKKVRDYAKRFPNVYDKPLDEFVHKPVYASIAGFADFLSKSFLNGETDKVEIIYQHFKTAATQLLTREIYLPFHIDRDAHLLHDSSEEDSHGFEYQVNYIIEPNPQELIDELIPKVIRLKLYTVLLDSMAAEHAARTVAMQIATENADILLQSLKVQYNKSRQQVITNELLDIIGGTVQ
jgi:F-type H+-transporting ATPase subunit gamma